MVRIRTARLIGPDVDLPNNTVRQIWIKHSNSTASFGWFYLRESKLRFEHCHELEIYFPVSKTLLSRPDVPCMIKYTNLICFAVGMPSTSNYWLASIQSRKGFLASPLATFRPIVYFTYSSQPNSFLSVCEMCSHILLFAEIELRADENSKVRDNLSGNNEKPVKCDLSVTHREALWMMT